MNIFRDPSHQERFEENGFVVVDALHDQEVQFAKRIYSETRVKMATLPSLDFLPTQSPQQRQDTHDLLAELGQIVVDRVLLDYEILLCSFVCKMPDSQEIGPHQDWTFVDEERVHSLNLWIPLVDVGAQNGALCLMRGSQRLDRVIRGTCIDNPFERIANLSCDSLYSQPMRAGQALAYDHRVVHGSPSNRSSAPRPVLVVGTAPKGEQVYHYRRHSKTGQFEEFRISQNFLQQYDFSDSSLSQEAEFSRDFDFENPTFTAEDLLPLLESKNINIEPNRKGWLYRLWAKVKP